MKRMEKRNKIFSLLFIVIAVSVLCIGCTHPFDGSDYSVYSLDLSSIPSELVGTEYEYLYDVTTVDDTLDYIAHPDSILLDSGNILTVFPSGHGRGAIRTRISNDGGLSWSGSLANTPSSWADSQETPTVFRLDFTDGSSRLILVSGNPKWSFLSSTTGGFNCSLSDDEGQTWSEFELFFGKRTEGAVVPIVAMASLVRLKENGVFVDKWMGVFHDADFHNYKSILTFDTEGKMHWSIPEKYFDEYRSLEKDAQMCEVCVIRSDGGQGDELCLIGRSNSKHHNSIVSFSHDEGETWSEPRFAPAALNGERHKVVYTDDGRLLITFRSIERGQLAEEHSDGEDGWLSEGWVAWVGTYADLKSGAEGQYRIKLAHAYKVGQTEPTYSANADTGYCGNVILSDGTIVTTSYGCFSPTAKTADGKKLKTYIISKRINLKDTDRLVELLNK